MTIDAKYISRELELLHLALDRKDIDKATVIIRLQRLLKQAQQPNPGLSQD